MNVFAYCCAEFAGATRRAAGVEPVTCPPVTAESFDLAQLAGRDFIYVDLHGDPGLAEWYALVDRGPFVERVVALTADQVRRADLRGAVVFLAACYGGDEASPMRAALLEAGARSVIAGPGKNFAGRHGLSGASLLGAWVRRLMALGAQPAGALAIARARVAVTAGGADAAEFKAWGAPGRVGRT